MADDRIRRTVDAWQDARPDLDATPALVLERVRLIADALDLRLRAPLAAAGLGRGDLDVLVELRHAGAPDLRPGDLQRRLGVTSGAVTKRVDRLAARGLVTRRVGADDARTRTVTLTPAGLRLTDAVVAEDLAAQAALLAQVGPAQRALLDHLLAELLRSVTSATPASHEPVGTVGHPPRALPPDRPGMIGA
ncbi:transcriptional regulator [Actinotalea ferrariae CF5-4]|uniref:Transcriptional regulator n=1 Tax=Actinotalea ferrariae CF5-4 TaxID=948458 RepID=A0A021W172_9CELL|nr:MarR family winged helix-turn-helix transcriptional regulator [Actinotalea ferrariae]EYR65077.1 transcriptional regulator [Actinotalea ferrariae CF5-4]